MLRVEPAPYTMALEQHLRGQWPGTLETLFAHASASQPWRPGTLAGETSILPHTRDAAVREVSTRLKRSPALVHVAGWNEPTVRAATLRAVCGGIPVVAELDTWRDQAHGAKRLLKRMLFPLYAQLITRFAAGGSRQKDFLVSLGVPERKIQVVNMTTDVTALQKIQHEERAAARDAFRRDIGVDESAPLVACVGRLALEKGVDVLLEAWRTVTAAVPTARLALVGDGALTPLAHSFAKRDPTIVVFGRMEPELVWRAYVASDLFVGPSRSEQWGLAVNEAMALGLPVVVTDAFGCIGDLVDHERTGLVTPADDAEALAEALARALLTPALRKAMAQNASERIASWTIDAQAKRTCSIWCDALGNSRT